MAGCPLATQGWPFDSYGGADIDAIFQHANARAIASAVRSSKPLDATNMPLSLRFVDICISSHEYGAADFEFSIYTDKNDSERNVARFLKVGRYLNLLEGGREMLHNETNPTI